MIARFLAKICVDLVTRCWTWTGSTSHNGYPFFRYLGKTRYTHVVSYLVFVGSIPQGWEIDHKCRNTRCTNPAHLEAVTKLENLRREAEANKPAACPQGHSYADPRNVRKTRHLLCAECHRVRERQRRTVETRNH